MQNDLAKRLRVKADVIQMGEKITWGSDSEIMREAADYIEQLSATQQPDEKPDIGKAISLLQIMRPGIRPDAYRDFLLSRGAWGKGGNSSYMHVSPDEIMRIAAHCFPEREAVGWQSPEKPYASNDKDVALLLSDGKVVAGCYDFHATDASNGMSWEGIGGIYFETLPDDDRPYVVGWQHLPVHEEKGIREYSNRQGLLDSWQPIETAPKDGTKILGFQNGIEILEWEIDDEHWRSSDGWNYYPTHWMPMPEYRRRGSVNAKEDG